MPAKQTSSKQRKPPRWLSKAGKALWVSVLDEYTLESEHHFRLLEHASRMLDVADLARQGLAEGGLIVEDRFQQPKENPCAQTERQAMNAFRLAIRELGLDLEDAPVEHRGPRRPGTRS
jgi:phage terminase small subunit